MTNTNTDSEEQAVNKNKRTLYIMFAVSIAPIALAYFSFFTGVGVPNTTASYGEVINPALRLETLLLKENSDFYDSIIKDKKWHLFIPLAENCNEECENILFLTRQVHIRLGEKSPRVERVLVNLGEGKLSERMDSLKEEHPLLKGIEVGKSDWLNLLQQGISQADPDIEPYYILVDQEGFAMMYYSGSISGGDLLKDLKRALKHSIDYQ